MLMQIIFPAACLAVIVDIQKKRTGLLLRIIMAAVLKSFYEVFPFELMAEVVFVYVISTCFFSTIVKLKKKNVVQTASMDTFHKCA